ncbi:MAG TPA: hypothetical protein VF824_20005 [Thermoanaerobaculia bacterium]
MPLLNSPHAHAQTAEVTRFLVPLQPRTVTGAFGSVWRTSLTVFYHGDVDTFIWPRISCGVITCPAGETLQRGARPRLFQQIASDAVGLLLVTEKGRERDFSFEGRVRDESRASESAGTEFPIVPDEEIRAEPVRLLDVPIRADFRVHLRVFALPGAAPQHVLVRYHRHDSLEPLREERIALRQFPPNPVFDVEPSDAEITGIEQLPEAAGASALWIEVTPEEPELRIWAFVSVTNNTTQEVTLITPQGR